MSLRRRRYPHRSAEEVGIKDRGHAILPQQDQRIGEGLEPGFNRRLEGLQRLRIMIGDQSDGMERVGLTSVPLKIWLMS